MSRKAWFTEGPKDMRHCFNYEVSSHTWHSVGSYPRHSTSYSFPLLSAPPGMVEGSRVTVRSWSHPACRPFYTTRFTQRLRMWSWWERNRCQWIRYSLRQLLTRHLFHLTVTGIWELIPVRKKGYARKVSSLSCLYSQLLRDPGLRSVSKVRILTSNQSWSSRITEMQWVKPSVPITLPSVFQ